MPDQDKDLVQLFVRDLDRIELPPRGRWRPAERKESIFMRTSRTIFYAGAVAAVLALALLAGFAMRDRGQVAAPPPTSTPVPTAATVSPTPTASPALTASAVPSASPSATAASTGAITGRFAYPSDYIPPVTVYAISTTDSRVWFSVDYRGVGNPPRPTPGPGGTGFTYTITGVAPGTYWVVAYRNDFPGQGPDPGYYSPQAECSRRAPSGPCPDVRLIPATVIAGQTTTGVDILTWGPPPPEQASPTFPPRPR